MPELNLDALWMPFTANRQFKAAPRFIERAEGMYYITPDGRQILDGVAGLWCVNAGHNRAPIVEAIRRQAGELDFAPAFQMGHPQAFRATEELAAMAPAGLSSVFFCNSGSEAVDSALKIALGYHRVRGQAERVKLIGRERGYHGASFAGIAVGGIASNRKLFPVSVPCTDHLRHTHDLTRNAFSRGEPVYGAELADELETRIVALHDASTVAAVIVEPLQGSTGVIVPPRGYLQRLREICDRHGILLIFDEVICGFGRLGHAWGADYFGVLPDIVTCAKGLTNGTVPMGAVLVRRDIHDAFMHAAAENAIEFPHGYTFSAHPLACAAARATMKLYQDEGIFQRAWEMAPFFEECVHALKGLPSVKDIRNLGLVAGIELESRPMQPGARGHDVYLHAWQQGLLTRATGDILAISPPLIIERSQVEQLFDILAQAIRASA